LTHTHLDISFIVDLVSWYMQTPHEIHWKAAKNIFWYFWVHISLGYITFQVGLLCWLVSLISDWIGDPDD
jgi:hypothetical protein